MRVGVDAGIAPVVDQPIVAEAGADRVGAAARNGAAVDSSGKRLLGSIPSGPAVSCSGVLDIGVSPPGWRFG